MKAKRWVVKCEKGGKVEGVIAPVSSPVSRVLKCIPESHMPSVSSQTENVPIEVQYD